MLRCGKALPPAVGSPACRLCRGGEILLFLFFKRLRLILIFLHQAYFHPHPPSLAMGFTSAQREQYASLLILGVAATIAVILRFIARARSKASFGLDDYFSLSALLFYLVYVGVSLWGRCTALSCPRKAVNHCVQGLRLAMWERTQQNCHYRYSG